MLRNEVHARATRRAFRVALLCGAAWLASLGDAPAQQQASGAARQVQYAIPGGALPSALIVFGRQAGLQVSYAPEVASGKRTNGVSGTMPAGDALGRLLAGTGLAYRFSGPRTVTIGDAGAASANAQAVLLDPISVEGQSAGSVRGYVATRTAAGTKTSTPIIETPQSVSVVTREQMDQRATQSIDEALRYSPGVTVAGKEDNRFDYASARGFSLVQYLDGLKLGTGSFAASQTEPYMLERIDILQGPASSLYGRSTPGGVIDMTSKRPTATPIREVQLQTGSFNRLQGAFDFGGALDSEGKLLARLTGLVRDTDTQVDYVKNERTAIAPAITWRPNADTTLTILANYQNDPSGGLYGRLPAAGSVYPAPAIGTIPTSFFFGDRNFNSYERTQHSIGYQFEHRFNNDWIVRQNARYRNVDLTYNFLYATTYLNPTTLRRNVITDAEKLDTYAVDNQVEGNFSTGPLQHKVLFGVDYHRNVWDYVNGVGTGPTISLTNPNYFQTVTSPAITSDLKQHQDQIGIYAQDQIKLGGFILTLGGRQDEAKTKQDNRLTHVETVQSDHAFTGRAGLTYVFANGVAPYVSYTESFEPTSGSDFFSVPFKPTTGQQKEAGIKYQPVNINALLTAAVFDIRQQNVLTADPDASHGNARVQTGEVQSRGYQFSATASPVQGLNLVASYAYLDNKVTSSNDAAVLVGSTPAGTPSQVASLWADYTFSSGPLSGFGLGAGVRRYGTTYGDNANTFSVPAYTLLDAKIQYELGEAFAAWRGLKLAINANNLLDTTYVAGCSTSTTCYYGFRRSVLATLTYRW